MSELTQEPLWRVGTKIPRNLYRGDEPIAMLATPELARELAEKLNHEQTLKAQLDAAPHSTYCYSKIGRPCNCWKSRVSGEE